MDTGRSSARRVFTGVLFVLCMLWGAFRLWRSGAGIAPLAAYAILGLPVFLVLYTFVGIVAFAAFLPRLDLSVPPSASRTIRHDQSHYEATFLETSHDTRGAHELIRVEIEPKGGNDVHYHRNLEETFEVLEGQLILELEGKPVKNGSRMQILWRYALILGYSETYLAGIPGFIQEPLIKALSRIGQWLGKDEELKVYLG